MTSGLRKHFGIQPGLRASNKLIFKEREEGKEMRVHVVEKMRVAYKEHIFRDGKCENEGGGEEEEISHI